MSMHRNTTASEWMGNAETPDWLTRFGHHVRAVLASIRTGFEAANDYNRLTAQPGVKPQDAVSAVYEKHFKR